MLDNYLLYTLRSSGAKVGQDAQPTGLVRFDTHISPPR